MAVLVVEDDRALGDLLAAVLRRSGTEVELVGRGDVALELIRSRQWDAVLLDLMLPGLNGADVLRRLRDSDPGSLSRIIVLTAASRAVLAKFEFTPLIWRLMRKPFEIADLIREVTDCVACHGAVPQIATWLELRSRSVGARAALLATSDGKLLTVRAAYGFAGGLPEEYFPLAVRGPYPICISVRSGGPVWVGSIKAPRSTSPAILPLWTSNGGQALATIPVHEGDGVVGAIGWSFDRPQQFGDTQCEAMAVIARDCAGVLSAQPTRASD